MFFVACLMLSVALQQTNALSSRLGSRVAAALAASIYDKSLREDRFSNPSPVDVVSLVATDCSKLQEAGASINFLWSAVVESLAIFAVLLGIIGRSALPGLGLILLVIPAQVRSRSLLSRLLETILKLFFQSSDSGKYSSARHSCAFAGIANVVNHPRPDDAHSRTLHCSTPLASR